MKKILNPFITSGYAGAGYFCNRKSESDHILQQINNGTSVTLTSVRRIGKTGLIHHVLSQLPKSFTGIYIDIQPTENRSDLLNALVTALINAVPQKSKPGKAIWEFVKSLRPLITFDALSGMPQVSLEVSHHKPETQLQSVLEFLETQPNKIAVAIDEFQQILSYPEKNTDAWMRGLIQQLHNIVFIFSGSRQHLMTDLFNSPSRPFYRSTQFMKIGKISANDYACFIEKHFLQNHRKITLEVIEVILEWSDLHTYYVQLLCNRLFATAASEITKDLVKSESLRILKETETVFFNYRDLLTVPQWMLLKAIAMEKRVYAPSAGSFLKKYHLSGSATVLQSLHSLIKKEMVYKETDTDGRSFYGVNDLLFAHWIRSIP
ncbi:MAG: ATP-binding protein [Bacteroidetes bacterium]|nr:ATP-binding protein [Bacteroidota bacterium]